MSKKRGGRHNNKRLTGGSLASLADVINILRSRTPTRVAPIPTIRANVGNNSVATPSPTYNIVSEPMIDNWTTTGASTSTRVTTVNDLPHDILHSIYDAMIQSHATIEDIRNFVTSHPTFYDVLQMQSEQSRKPNELNAIELLYKHLMSTWNLATKQGNNEPPIQLSMICMYKLLPSNDFVTLQMVLKGNATSQNKEPEWDTMKINETSFKPENITLDNFKIYMNNAVSYIKTTYPSTTQMLPHAITKIVFRLGSVSVNETLSEKNKNIFNLLNLLIGAANLQPHVNVRTNADAIITRRQDEYQNNLQSMMQRVGYYYSPLSQSYLSGQNQIFEQDDLHTAGDK